MNILNFVSMITIPLIATPMVYLSGRLGTRETVLHSRSYLVRGLALLAILLAWIPFVVSARAFLAGGVLEFSIESIWLRMDGISLLVAAMALTLGTLVVVFSGPYMAGEV
ncbi:MAG TPA: hypothetical protein PLN43_15990, partial [Anaerolineales bacterium]|nr:hypothetical protein [Anaerolineales bacterium]